MQVTKTKKLFLISFLAMLSTMSFAYTATISNQGVTTVNIVTNGQTVCTATGKQTTTCSLDPYTAYSANYKGTYADQGLFTLQKYSSQVLQTTPVIADTARANFIINVNADGKTGSVDNFQNSAAQYVSSGICHNDSGGVTCNLASGDTLKSLQITLDERQEPRGGDTPTPQPSGGYTKDYGKWDQSKAYEPIWSPSTQYPEVEYNGKQWVACSAVKAGAVPGESAWPHEWNAWVEYNGSKVCG